MKKVMFTLICLLSLTMTARGQAKLGFVAWDLTESLQYWRAQGYNYNFGTTTGVYIEYIKVDGPAYNAGLMAYDVITAIDNKRISHYSDFQNIMNQKKIGQTISVTYYRNMMKYNTSVLLTKDSDQGYLMDGYGNYYTTEQIKQMYGYTDYTKSSDIDWTFNRNTTKHSDEKKDDKKQDIKKKDDVKKSDVDIKVPKTKIKNPNTFAVIIGNEEYENEAKVPYAENDAKTFKEYVQNTLGVPEKQIKLVTNAGLNSLRGAIKWLKQAMEISNGQGKAIFYYAGHGIPDEADKAAYLLPTDGNGSDPESGYSLSRLYKELGTTPSKNITIFLDACFSGTKREGDMMASARGVAIKVKQSAPEGNMIIFTAAQGDETAYPFEEQQHGLFTYYLLKKLQTTKGETTLGELNDYLNAEVTKQSFLVNNKKQTPSVSTSSSLNNSWRALKMK